MNVLLDDNPIEVEDHTLAAAMSAGVEIAQQTGRAVVEVLVDGKAVRGEELIDASTEPIPDARVELYTADPIELVSQSLRDAAAALESARGSHTDIAGRLQSGADIPEALSQLSGTLSVWQGVQDVLARGYALLGRDPSTLDLPDDVAGGKTLNDLLTELGGQLREVRRSLEDHDLAALADTVGYELEPLAGVWAGVLSHAAGAITQS
ncbi:MAG: hypothetical protein KDA31_14120 [Phycisphaerales bacterium]|nr:hypothetical protein [Phycisphaerales bacterium]MCB9837493.1 hypothetical protein [Phycisphaera sp.]